MWFDAFFLTWFSRLLMRFHLLYTPESCTPGTSFSKPVILVMLPLVFFGLLIFFLPWMAMKKINREWNGCIINTNNVFNVKEYLFIIKKIKYVLGLTYLVNPLLRLAIHFFTHCNVTYKYMVCVRVGPMISCCKQRILALPVVACRDWEKAARSSIIIVSTFVNQSNSK